MQTKIQKVNPMNSRIAFITAFLVLAGLTFGCGLFSERYEKNETEEFKISAAGKSRLVLDNINGRIELIASSDSENVKVIAVKEITVPKKDLNKPFEEIKLRIDTSGNDIRIDSDIKSKTKLRFFSFGTIKGPKVDYEIHIPSGLAVEISNVNGNISSNRLATDVSIELINGNITFRNYSGLFESEVTNGEVSLSVDSTSGIDIETVNGSVDIDFGKYVAGKLKAETTNGKIVDENLDLSNVTKEKKLLKGEFGTSPSTSISISTVNGRITLKGKGSNWQ